MTDVHAVWEVIPDDFDGGGDQDDRVIWVMAPTRQTVVDLVGDWPIQVCVDSVIGAAGDSIDFSLPLDGAAFQAALSALVGDK